MVIRAKLLRNFHSLEMKRNFSYCMRVHIQPLLFPPILHSFWVFVFYVNHMVVKTSIKFMQLSFSSLP